MNAIAPRDGDMSKFSSVLWFYSTMRCGAHGCLTGVEDEYWVYMRIGSTVVKRKYTIFLPYRGDGPR